MSIPVNNSTSPLGSALQVRAACWIKVPPSGFAVRTIGRLQRNRFLSSRCKPRLQTRTNFGDYFQRQIPTLSMFGPADDVTVFYQPLDPTHANEALWADPRRPMGSL